MERDSEARFGVPESARGPVHLDPQVSGALGEEEGEFAVPAARDFHPVPADQAAFPQNHLDLEPMAGRDRCGRGPGGRDTCEDGDHEDASGEEPLAIRNG